MQNRFRVCLPLRESTRAIERLAQLCGEWRNIPLAETKRLETGHCWEDATQSVESKLLDLPAGFVWAMRHRVRDNTDASLTWMTDIGLAVEQGTAWLSVGNHIATSEHAPLRPIIRPRTRPRIVPAAIREFGCRYPVGPAIRILESTPDSIRGFLEEIYDPQRRYPIVFVSCRNDTDCPVADAEELGDWLAGVASVIVAQNRFPSRKLAESLPPNLNCWDGAVRLYWPGLSATDPPNMHRVWRPELIREHDDTQNGGVGFKAMLLGRISDLALHRLHLRYIDWQTVERLEAEHDMRREMARARSEGNPDELLKLFESENLRLTDQLRIAIDERNQQRERADRLEVEKNYWRTQSQTEKGGQSNPQEMEFVPHSVGEAVDWAETNFSSQLVFALNSRSDRCTAYTRPSEVAIGLRWLATTYRDAKLGITGCADLDLSIKGTCGAWWFWKGGQSDTTVGIYSNWYECSHAGQKHEVREHIGSGKSKRPEETVRIAFKWLDVEEKVLIGFIGQHQRTTKT